MTRMIPSPGITLRILSRNRRQFLEQSLASIFSQTEPISCVELYDNASDFSFADIKTAYPDLKLKILSIAVPWIRNAERAFMDPPTTEWICVFHDDDLLQPDFHAEMCKMIRDNKKIGAISCSGFVVDEKGIQTGDLLPNLKQDVILRGGVDLSRWYCESFIPFPPTVYRWEDTFNADLEFAAHFGRCADVAIFSRVVQRHPILISAKKLFSYRRHSKQESAGFLWWEENKRWHLQVDLCRNDPTALRHIIKKRNARLTSRWLNAWLRGESRPESLLWDFFSPSSAHRFLRNHKVDTLRRLMKACWRRVILQARGR